MTDTFLQRVMEQRDREQWIAIDPRDPLGAADTAREAYLETQLRLRCATPGCGKRLHATSAARGDTCARCTRRLAVKSAAKLCGCGSAFTSTKYDKCWRCRVGQKSHRADAPAPPAKETVMAEVEKRMCAGGCGRKLRINSRGDRCKFCRVAGSPEPVKPRAAKPKATPPADDVVALLQSQLDGCDRCTRLRRAIEALSGA